MTRDVGVVHGLLGSVSVGDELFTSRPGTTLAIGAESALLDKANVLDLIRLLADAVGVVVEVEP